MLFMVQKPFFFKFTIAQKQFSMIYHGTTRVFQRKWDGLSHVILYADIIMHSFNIISENQRQHYNSPN